MHRFHCAALAAVAVIGFASIASAADMPVKAVKAPPVPMWSWTGFYLGGYAGVAVNRSHGFDPTGDSNGELNFLGTGFTGGATAGYNWQFAPNWVAGIEGDIGYLGLSHDVQQYNEANFRTNQKTSWIGTLRGRFGYTNGPSLSYITGGVASVHFDDVISNALGTVSVDSAKTKTGFAVGSGVETRLGGNWTAKSEFLYVDVGRGDTLTEGVATSFTLQTDTHRYSMQRFGVNYLFNNGPQAPLPAGNWTGFYVGAVGGGAVTQTRLTAAPQSPQVGEFGNNGNGYTLGVLGGYNWQFAPAWVVGVEGDFSWLGINHTVDDYNESLALYTLNTKWLATARGRVGYSTGPALLYVTGGGAWVNYKESWDFGPGPFESTKTLGGYTVGGGIEAKLGNGWTARSEYLYVNVGDGDALLEIPGNHHIVANHQFHLFRSALVYPLGH
jgi:outer membrane immunogenic protein